eukprot:6213327-Pleurochrysis_carterae.AAC.1
MKVPAARYFVHRREVASLLEWQTGQRARPEGISVPYDLGDPKHQSRQNEIFAEEEHTYLLKLTGRNATGSAPPRAQRLPSRRDGVASGRGRSLGVLTTHHVIPHSKAFGVQKRYVTFADARARLEGASLRGGG